MTVPGVTTSSSDDRALRVLLVEPYYSGSHRAWADGWVRHSRHDVGLITHSAEFWRWRMRGSAVTLAEQARAWVSEHGRPDVLMISDMIDLPGFLGLTRSMLHDVPVVFYVHENQLLHPLGPKQQLDEALGLINWRSLVAADQVWFNSAFQRDGLLAELPRFLKRMPDHGHGHLITQVEECSAVFPVGVETARLIDTPRGRRGDVPLVLWNQRWDHDKNPTEVFGALVDLAADGVPFEFALAGENERVDPQEFFRVQKDLGARVVHVGYAPASEYHDLLLRSDVVLSAAHHEFFGISIVEAVAAGAVPILPDRLSYPEIVPPQWHSAALYPEGDLRVCMQHVVEDLEGARQSVSGLRESMRRFDWSVVAPLYDDGITAVAGHGPRQG